MASERNPFPQDIEQHSSPVRRNYFERFVIPCASAIGGMIVYIYFMSMIDPLELGNKGFSPRFPTNIANTSRRSITALPNDPLSISVNLTSAAVHSVPFAYEPTRTANRTTISGLSTNNRPIKTNITSVGVLSVSVTRDSKIGRSEFQQVVLKYPEIPTAEICIGKRMSQAEFLDKQWFCYRCGLAFDAKNMTHVDATTAEQFRYDCHINCCDNEVFQACAHHLYLVQEDSSIEARQCTYCQQKPHSD